MSFMNIKEFIHFTDNCPFCREQLKTFFLSKRKQVSYINDNNANVFFDLNSLNKKEPSYKVNIIFNLLNNNFLVNFYSKDYIEYSSKININVLSKFKKFINNIKGCQIYRSCEKCLQYSYCSNNFDFDFKSTNIGTLYIKNEIFSVAKNFNDGYKYYSLHNNYHTSKSIIISEFESVSNKKDIYLTTDLIKIKDGENFVSKIDKLIIFS